jgi:hypothetical protein
MTVIIENINPEDINLSDLTKDCVFVYRNDGTVDIVKVSKMSDAFDYYYDRQIKLNKITWTGGLRNPKVDKPKVTFKDLN